MDWGNALIRYAQRKMRENVNKAKNEFVNKYKDELSKGRVEDESLSPYRESQARRRSKKGLQTGNKDLMFSKTLVNSIKEVDRKEGYDFIEITIGFTGRAHRRDDQGDSLDNDRLANYLARQQRSGKPILRLSKQQKNDIELKYGVTIS